MDRKNFIRGSCDNSCFVIYITCRTDATLVKLFVICCDGILKNISEEKIIIKGDLPCFFIISSFNFYTFVAGIKSDLQR